MLPLRCINSKHIGGSAKFEQLLSGLGLRELLPKRCTPRLIFYILGRIQDSETVANFDSTPKNDSTKNKKRKLSGMNTSNELAVGENGWKIEARANIAALMSDSVKAHFAKDCSDIPPTEFSVQIPSDLLL